MATTQETSYRIIHPQRAVFDPAEAALGDLMGSRECAFVVDREVMRIYGSRLVDYARLHLKCATVIDVDAREHNKSLREVERICGVLERLAFPRNAVLVGVGGGVTLDTGGLAASLYRRGISYVRIPTTLVGLVDVAVGIKHGVNFQGQKNLLGTFYPPLACINDSQFLRTLNQRDLACGIAEIIKVALMCDPVLFELLELHVKGLMLSGFSMPGAIAEEVLIRAEMSMMRELQSNLFEHDYRRLMDFGHTFSQKLEIASDHRLAHGEAVALDMLLTTAVAVERGICHTSVLQRLKDLYQVVGLPDWDELLTPQLVLDGVKSSVAHRGGSLNLPLPTGIGLACFAQALDVEDVDAAFALVGRHALATVNA